MQTNDTETNMNLVRQLTEAELNIVNGGTKGESFQQVLQVNLGNMTIRGYVGDKGSTLGESSSGNDTRLHYGPA